MLFLLLPTFSTNLSQLATFDRVKDLTSPKEGDNLDGSDVVGFGSFVQLIAQVLPCSLSSSLSGYFVLLSASGAKPWKALAGREVGSLVYG